MGVGWGGGGKSDSCIKMGSDESHFNVSLIAKDKIPGRQYPQTTTFEDCIKMGSDESHFNVSLIAKDKIPRRQCPQTTTFEDSVKVSRTSLWLLPPAQTGSLHSAQRAVQYIIIGPWL